MMSASGNVAGGAIATVESVAMEGRFRRSSMSMWWQTLALHDGSLDLESNEGIEAYRTVRELQRGKSKINTVFLSVVSSE